LGASMHIPSLALLRCDQKRITAPLRLPAFATISCFKVSSLFPACFNNELSVTCSVADSEALAVEKSVTAVSGWETYNSDAVGEEDDTEHAESTFTSEDLGSSLVPMCGVLLHRRRGRENGY